MKSPTILFPQAQESWVDLSIQKLEELILSVLKKKSQCNIFLTGGRSAEVLYSQWASHVERFPGQINFYWGDERYVPLGSKESNYSLAAKTLFKNGVPANCRIFPMETELGDPQQSAEKYESILPESIDIVLLSMGLDAHIASLFPGNKALFPTDKKVLHIEGPKPPKDRLTLTANVLREAKNIVLFVIGDEKGQMAARALQSGGDVFTFPVCLVSHGIWVMDSEAKKYN